MDSQEPSPYAPPQARAEGVDGVEATDAELRAVVGPRADYYLKSWRRTGGWGRNWAAFFFSAFWMIFRRMYAVAAVVFVVGVVEGIVEGAVFAWFGYAEVPRAFDRLTTFAFNVVCTIFGNRWYHSHVRKVIVQTRALGLPEDEHLRALARRGGTRPWHVVGAVAVLGALLATLGAVLSYLGVE